MTAISCPWCDALAFHPDTHCRGCGHEVWRNGVPVSRLMCGCTQCCRRAGVGVPTAAEQESILAELDQEFGHNRRQL